MPDNTEVAAPQPAPSEVQPSGVKKTDGPANMSESEMARRFSNNRQQATAAPEPKAELPPEKTKEEVTPSPAEQAETTAKPEAAAESETETEADEALSKSTSLTPEQQAIFDKRIGKAVAKQRKAERDTAELKLKLAEYEARSTTRPAPQAEDSPSIVPLPTGAPVLANIDTVQALMKLETEAKQAVRFAEDAIESIRDGEAPPQGWDKASLREVMRNARKTLEDEIPQRREFLTTRHQMQQKAYEVLPFMNDNSSADYKAAQLIYQRHPFLRQIPEGDFTVGLIVEGIKAVESRQRASTEKKPDAPEKKLPVISKPRASGDQTAVSESGGATRTTPGTSKEKAMADERAKLTAKHGVSQGDYAAFLSRQSQLRNSS